MDDKRRRILVFILPPAGGLIVITLLAGVVIGVFGALSALSWWKSASVTSRRNGRILAKQGEL